MKLFSERYNYTNPSEVIIRERITPAIKNAIFNCLDRLKEEIENNCYYEIEKYIWGYFLNKRICYFSNDKDVIINFIEDSSNEWYSKLDLLELIINLLLRLQKTELYITPATEAFINELNFEFERLHFAYRIVNNQITEITSEVEIKAIEQALDNSKDNIKFHLDNALKLYSAKPNGDYNNSIKESISAVEVICREKAKQDTLGKALNQLEKNGIVIPKLLKLAFEKLYAYTNLPETGIRHALMEEEGKGRPSAEEALFMLVSCSSFVNYLNKKIEKPIN